MSVVRAVVEFEPIWVIRLSYILIPSQGSFNLMIYIGHRIYNYRRIHPDVSKCAVFCQLFKGKANDDIFFTRISLIEIDKDEEKMEVRVENEINDVEQISIQLKERSIVDIEDNMILSNISSDQNIVLSQNDGESSKRSHVKWIDDDSSVELQSTISYSASKSPSLLRQVISDNSEDLSSINKSDDVSSVELHSTMSYASRNDQSSRASTLHVIGENSENLSYIKDDDFADNSNVELHNISFVSGDQQSSRASNVHFSVRDEDYSQSDQDLSYFTRGNESRISAQNISDTSDYSKEQTNVESFNLNNNSMLLSTSTRKGLWWMSRLRNPSDDDEADNDSNVGLQNVSSDLRDQQSSRASRAHHSVGEDHSNADQDLSYDITRGDESRISAQNISDTTDYSKEQTNIESFNLNNNSMLSLTSTRKGLWWMSRLQNAGDDNEADNISNIDELHNISSDSMNQQSSSRVSSAHHSVGGDHSQADQDFSYIARGDESSTSWNISDTNVKSSNGNNNSRLSSTSRKGLWWTSRLQNPDKDKGS